MLFLFCVFTLVAVAFALTLALILTPLETATVSAQTGLPA